MITLRIISASNLPAADINGLSDPYVRVCSKNFGPFSQLAKPKQLKTLKTQIGDGYLLLFSIHQFG